MHALHPIFAAYLVTAVLVGGLCVTTWLAARRARRALALRDAVGRE